MMNPATDLNTQRDSVSPDTPIRVFLIDDDAVVLSTLHLGLQQHGFHVTCFTTGESALRAWRASPPDAAVVDVELPDINGGDLVPRLLASAHRPILALSQRSPLGPSIVCAKRKASEPF